MKTTIKRSITFSILLTTILGLVGCKPNLKTLIGTKWTLESIHTTKGQKLEPLKFYTVQIEEGSLTAKLDVNVCRYDYEIKGQKLLISDNAVCTKACCDSDMASIFAKKLAGEKTVVLEEDELMVIGADTLFFRPWKEEDDKKEVNVDYLGFRRTGCFGACPIYELNIKGNGDATYYGRRFVEKEGLVEEKLDAGKVEAVFKAARAIDFKTLQAVYDNPQISDMESVFIEFNGTTIKVREKTDAPKELLDLIDDIHQLAVDAGWVKP